MNTATHSTRRPRAGRTALLAVLALGAAFGLTSCTNAAAVGVQRHGDGVVVLVGYQCAGGGFLKHVGVGRERGKEVGPTVWAIDADQPKPVPELPVGTVPDGYHVAVDDLRGAALGTQFWVQVTTADNQYGGVSFDIRKLADGGVMDSSGNVISRADFDKRYHCSS